MSKTLSSAHSVKICRTKISMSSCSAATVRSLQVFVRFRNEPFAAVRFSFVRDRRRLGRDRDFAERKYRCRMKIVGISIRERSTAHRRRKSPCIIMHSRDRDGKGRHAPQNRRRRSALGSLSRRERVAASRFALAIRQNDEKHGKTIAIARSRERRKPKHAEPRFVKWTASI